MRCTPAATRPSVVSCSTSASGNVHCAAFYPQERALIRPFPGRRFLFLLFFFVVVVVHSINTQMHDVSFIGRVDDRLFGNWQRSDVDGNEKMAEIRRYNGCRHPLTRSLVCLHIYPRRRFAAHHLDVSLKISHFWRNSLS